MRYADFRDLIQSELGQHAAGLTWSELKQRLNLPYSRPCPTWVIQMEADVGLTRTRGAQSAYVWKIAAEPEPASTPANEDAA